MTTAIVTLPTGQTLTVTGRNLPISAWTVGGRVVRVVEGGES